MQCNLATKWKVHGANAAVPAAYDDNFWLITVIPQLNTLIEHSHTLIEQSSKSAFSQLVEVIPLYLYIHRNGVVILIATVAKTIVHANTKVHWWHNLLNILIVSCIINSLQLHMNCDGDFTTVTQPYAYTKISCAVNILHQQASSKIFHYLADHPCEHGTCLNSHSYHQSGITFQYKQLDVTHMTFVHCPFFYPFVALNYSNNWIFINAHAP